MPQRATGYIVILALLLLQAGVAQSTSSYSRNKRSKFFLAASHSNFLRSNFHPQQQLAGDVRCHNNASVCSDLNKNPGGGICCFNWICKQTQSDDNNCGGCNKACSYGLSCCDGKCVNLMTDSRHCGRCNTCCHHKVACEFGLCGYGGGGYAESEEQQQSGESSHDAADAGNKFRYPKQW